MTRLATVNQRASVPAILCVDLADENAQRTGEHWHGWLTSGEFKSC